MAGAYCGVNEPEAALNVGVSGPGVVRWAIENMSKTADLGEVANTIKKTAFKTVFDFIKNLINIQNMKNIFLYFLSILNNGNKCRHTNALLNSNEGYCPDCGVYLKKYYYVLRCGCCSHKREASKSCLGKHNEITPISKFCPICGGKDFI